MSKTHSPMTTWPADLVLTPLLEKFAADAGLDAREQWEAFHDSALANGRKYADWRAAFRTWCRNAKKWGNEKKPIGFVEQQVRVPVRRLVDELYEREIMSQTREQRAANLQRLKEIIGSIK
jgi:hypothetical protein